MLDAASPNPDGDKTMASVNARRSRSTHDEIVPITFQQVMSFDLDDDFWHRNVTSKVDNWSVT
jgi:hypothetical protein